MIKHWINLFADPKISFPIIVLLYFFLVPPTKWFEKWNKRLGWDRIWTNTGGWIIHIFLVGGFLLCMPDDNFRKIVTKPDNIPIVILLFTSVFFLWLSMKQARDNDIRLERGEKPNEYCEPKTRNVLVWPDLVYIELIAMVLCMAALIFWSVLLQAPLEEPANPTLAPNPSKAPWYFLALQEMLVYFDPWLAGVVFPTVIIIGLMAIPYMDADSSTSGYYSFSRRKLFISLFNFGWLVMWVYLIIVGTFMRGPNWNFFGPFEPWNVHKVVPMNNINLSEVFWIQLLGRPLPDNVLLREGIGIIVLIAYFAALPLLLGKTCLKGFRAAMGPYKYGTFMFLSLMALLLPIKMFLRWIMALKYIVEIPGWFNI